MNWIKQQQADADFTGDTFTSRFAGTWMPPEYRDKSENGAKAPSQWKSRTLRWSEFKRMQAEEMLTHVQSKVFPFFKDLNGLRIQLYPPYEKRRVSHSQTVAYGRSGEDHR